MPEVPRALFSEKEGNWLNDNGVRRYHGPSMCESISIVMALQAVLAPLLYKAMLRMYYHVSTF